MQQIFLLGAVRPVTYFYTVTTVLAVVFSMISPETGLPYWQELVLWLAQTLIPLSMILGIHLLLCRFCRFNRLKTVLKLSLSAILAIVLYSPIAYFIDILFNIQAMPTDTARVPLEIIDELGGVGPPLLISWLALNLPLLLGYRFEKHPEPVNWPTPPAQLPQLRTVYLPLITQTREAQLIFCPKILTSSLLYS